MSGLFEALDTPALLVDLDKLDANLGAMAELAGRHGVRLLPHTKSHRCAEIARLQLGAGAAGLTCQTLDEVEAMTAVEPSEVLVPVELIGARKLRRAAQLAARVPIATVIDSEAGAAALEAAAAAEGVGFEVLIEVASSYKRCGVVPAQAPKLAAYVGHECPHLRLTGVLIYEGHIYDVPEPDAVAAAARDTYELIGAVAQRLRGAGHPIARVSVGASAAAAVAAAHPAVTELRCGSYAFRDRTQVATAGGSLDQCALHVLTTVISTPAEDRIVLDAGSKTLSFAEIPDWPGYGTIVGHPDAIVARLSDEHAMVDVPDSTVFGVGDLVRIVPNAHALCVSQFPELHAIRGHEHVGSWPIVGRRRADRQPIQTSSNRQMS